MKALGNLFLLIAFLTVCGCIASGCWGGSSSTRVLQDKFAFPNSDLTPLGHVSAEVSHTTFLVPPDLNKEAYDELSQEALKQKGGDTLTDSVVTSDTTCVLLICSATFKVDGTAVKVVQLGRQELH